jgi:STE24 endopeptidase
VGMNIFALIILIVLVAEFVLNFVADILNLKSATSDLPAEFESIFDAETYSKSQAYLRDTTRFDWIHSSVNLVVLLVFWFAGGFGWLDRIVCGWANDTVLCGLAFIGLLVLSKMILNLPFSAYSTFVIEERYGFNRTTWSTFVLDLVKGLTLGILLGGPLLAAVIFVLDRLGPSGWLACWAITVAVMLVIQYVAPKWIMPLFNKFTLLEEGELRDRITGYADTVGFALKDVYVIDGSRRSSKANAFFTGFGKNRRIALYDTLIERHKTDELVAVLAHEIGHYKRHHILQGMLISVVHTGLLFLVLSLVLPSTGLFEAFGVMEGTPVYAGLVFFGLLYRPVELVLGVVLNAWSRRNEYEADRFAVSTSGLGGALVEGLKKLSRDNLSNLTPHPFFVFLNYSHPPLLRRIERIREGA